MNFPFTNRYVRDLAWVIASPPLVSGAFDNVIWWGNDHCSKEYEDCLAALLQLDKKPQPLINCLNTLNSQRLGVRFEALVSFWLASVSPNYRLLAQNIQLHEIANDTQSRTLGEMDFIIQDRKSGKTIHLEVAVKFYLGTPRFTDPYRWFGTNLNDQLGKKIDHLKQHQTRLANKYPQHMPYAIDEQQCFIKGRLFYPYGESTPPQGINSNHLRGRWLYPSQQTHEQALILLHKDQWLSELTSHDIQNSQIGFSETEKPQCYASVIKNKANDSIERERIFCLPDNFQFPQMKDQ